MTQKGGSVVHQHILTYLYENCMREPERTLRGSGRKICVGSMFFLTIDRKQAKVAVPVDLYGP